MNKLVTTPMYHLLWDIVSILIFNTTSSKPIQISSNVTLIKTDRHRWVHICFPRLLLREVRKFYVSAPGLGADRADKLKDFNNRLKSKKLYVASRKRASYRIQSYRIQPRIAPPPTYTYENALSIDEKDIGTITDWQHRILRFTNTLLPVYDKCSRCNKELNKKEKTLIKLIELGDKL